MNARMMAPAPNAAVPPSVRQAWRRLMKKPQRMRENVKRTESAALQTLRVSSAMEATLWPAMRGKSCITADMIASGPDNGAWEGAGVPRGNDIPRRHKMSLASKSEGKRRVRKWMCVIYWV